MLLTESALLKAIRIQARYSAAGIATGSRRKLDACCTKAVSLINAKTAETLPKAIAMRLHHVLHARKVAWHATEGIATT
jgi:hypothetical protein